MGFSRAREEREELVAYAGRDDEEGEEEREGGDGEEGRGALLDVVGSAVIAVVGGEHEAGLRWIRGCESWTRRVGLKEREQLEMFPLNLTRRG